MKRKRCRMCNDLYTPQNILQRVCGWSCAIAYNKTQDGKKSTDKAYRADKRERKEKLKTKSQVLKETQRVFNKWIRNRDAGNGCLMCGKNNPDRKYNACHFRSVGAYPELRFCPDNVHLGCETCNSFLSGNLVEYRINLIEKIGINRVCWLERSHPPKHYTIDEIKEIKKHYQQLNKAISS